jgi:tRNA(adenine34) deaminase
VPVGAVVVCGGKVVAKAHNLTQRLQDPTAHAEMLAITSASHYLSSRYLNECTLYVTLEPCCMCAGATHWALMGRVVFGASDEQRGYRHFSERIAHPRTEVVTGVLADEAEALLKAFFARRRP